MIHIATVHWQTDQWIDLQLYFLEKYIQAPYRVYAFLNGVAPEHYKKFDFSCDEPIEEHAIKLNLLGHIIAAQAQENDILIFLDGDAFPIAPMEEFMESILITNPLAAIVRKESYDDIQPHPSFCITTVGFWKHIKGDWKRGHNWIDSQGTLVSDVGGNLLKALAEHKTDWQQLYRTQSLGDHPIWYGIYHGLIYHHGAGFRPPAERIDVKRRMIWSRALWWTSSKSRSLYAVLDQLWQKAMDWEIARHQLKEHDAVYQKIRQHREAVFDPSEAKD